MSPQNGRMEDTEMQHWLTWCTMVDGEPLRSTHSEQYIDGAWTLEAYALLLLVSEDGANTHESNYMLDWLDCLIFHSKHCTILTFNTPLFYFIVHYSKRFTILWCG